MGLLDGPLQSAFRAVASVLGTTCVLTRTTRVYDPLRSESFDDTATHTLRVIRGAEEMELINADSTKKHQHDILVEALDTDGVAVTPDPVKDVITLAGTAWRLAKVKPVNGSDRAVMYEVTLQQ